MAMTSKITDMILTAFLALGPVKAENDRLDKLDAEDKKETDGWRIGTRIRKGKDKQEQIGIVIQVVSLNDDANEFDYAYIFVLWENEDAPVAPGRGKKDILKFRKAYKKAYKDGLGDRSLDITDKQLIDAWCACPLPPPPFSRAARFRRQSHA